MAYESDGNQKQPWQFPIPWMRQGQQVGVGDAIKRATSALGIQPCNECQRRAAILNGRLVFVGSRKR